MAVQRGNVQCVQGAYGESAFEELDEIFYIVQPNDILKIYFDLLNMNKNYPYVKPQVELHEDLKKTTKGLCVLDPLIAIQEEKRGKHHTQFIKKFNNSH